MGCEQVSFEGEYDNIGDAEMDIQPEHFGIKSGTDNDGPVYEQYVISPQGPAAANFTTGDVDSKAMRKGDFDSKAMQKDVAHHADESECDSLLVDEELLVGQDC